MDIVKKTGLTFKEAYEVLKAGGCVKRAEWLGYWVVEKGSRTSGAESVTMYCKDGRIVDMLFGCDPMFTLGNCCADDWMVVDEKHRKELDRIRESGILCTGETSS